MRAWYLLSVLWRLERGVAWSGWCVCGEGGEGGRRMWVLLQKDVGESDGRSDENGQEAWVVSQQVVDKSRKCSGYIGQVGSDASVQVQR